MLEVGGWQVLVAWLRCSVSFAGGVPTVPFLPEAERVHTVRAIEREDPVEVIDFVLQKFRSIALEVEFHRRTLQVLVSNSDPVGSLDSNHQVWKGKAVIPDKEVFRSDVDDLGIDQRPGAIHLNVDNPHRGPDLWGCNRPAGSKP
jgi:hypothetical protein